MSTEMSAIALTVSAPVYTQGEHDQLTLHRAEGMYDWTNRAAPMLETCLWKVASLSASRSTPHM